MKIDYWYGAVAIEADDIENHRDILYLTHLVQTWDIDFEKSDCIVLFDDSIPQRNEFTLKEYYKMPKKERKLVHISGIRFGAA